MLAHTYTLVSLYAAVASAQQTITYSAGATNWNLTGPVQKMKRSAFRYVCPDIAEADDADALYIPASDGAFVTLQMEGLAVRVYGLSFPSCAGSDDRTSADLDIVGPPSLPSESAPLPTESAPTPSCIMQPASCDQLLVERGEQDGIIPGNILRLRIAPGGSAVYPAPIVVFNATVLLDGAFPSGSSPLSGTSDDDGPQDIITTTTSTLPPQSQITTTTTSTPSITTTTISSAARSGTTAAVHHRIPIIAPVVTVVLVALCAIIAGTLFVRRRRSRNTSAGDGGLLPYMLHAPARHSAVATKRVAGTEKLDNSLPSYQPRQESEPQLREISDAMRRVGFSSSALLASLNRLQAQPLEDAAGSSSSPPKYVV